MTDKRFNSVTEALEDANKRMKTEGVQLAQSDDHVYMMHIFHEDVKELRAKWDARELGVEYNTIGNYTTYKRRIDDLGRKVVDNTITAQDFVNFASMLSTMTAEPVWWDTLFPRVAMYF